MASLNFNRSCCVHSLRDNPKNLERAKAKKKKENNSEREGWKRLMFCTSLQKMGYLSLGSIQLSRENGEWERESEEKIPGTKAASLRFRVSLFLLLWCQPLSLCVCTGKVNSTPPRECNWILLLLGCWLLLLLEKVECFVVCIISVCLSQPALVLAVAVPSIYFLAYHAAWYINICTSRFAAAAVVDVWEKKKKKTRGLHCWFGLTSRDGNWVYCFSKQAKKRGEGGSKWLCALRARDSVWADVQTTRQSDPMKHEWSSPFFLAPSFHLRPPSSMGNVLLTLTRSILLKDLSRSEGKRQTKTKNENSISATLPPIGKFCCCCVSEVLFFFFLFIPTTMFSTGKKSQREMELLAEKWDFSKEFLHLKMATQGFPAVRIA